MKNVISPIALGACVVAAFSFVTSGHAALIVSDNFNLYTAPGDLNGEDGGTDGTGSWSTAWAADAAVDVVSPGFTGYGNAAQSDNRSTSSLASRQFTAQMQTIYVGFTFRSSATDNNDFIQIGLNNSTSDLGSNNGMSAVWLGQGGTDRISARTLGNTANGAATLTPDTPYALVLKLTWDGDSYRGLDIFIDQATEGTAYASNTTESNLTALSWFRIRTNSLEATDGFTFDNLKIGTAYSDVYTVAVIPEPGSLAAVVVGGVGMLALLRRRRRSQTI